MANGTTQTSDLDGLISQANGSSQPQSGDINHLIAQANGQVKTPPAPNPFEPIMKAIAPPARAFASALPTGALTPLEQMGNLSQYAYRHLPQQLQGVQVPNIPGVPLTDAFNAITANKQPYIDAINKAVGTSRQPYLDVTGKYNRTNQPWLGGQTPTQAQAGQPVATTLGNLAGSLPAALAGGGLGAGAGLLGKIATGSATAGLYGAGFGGLDEAANEAVNTDALDPGQIAQAAGTSGLIGAGVGALGEGAIAGLPAIPEALKYAKAKKNVEQIVKGIREAPKALPYDANAPIIPPGPTEQLRQRGRELFEQDRNQALEGSVEEAALTQPSPPVAPESWRQFRDEGARDATPEEAKRLAPIARTKATLDRAAARLEGAIKQIDPNARTRFLKRDISPSDYKKIDAYIKQHGGQKKLGEPFVEAALGEAHAYIPDYKFQTNDAIKELKGLVEEFTAAKDKYEAQRPAAAKYLKVNEPVRVGIKDADKTLRVVNIKLRQQATPRGITFDDPNVAAGMFKLRQTLKRDYSQPFWSTYDQFVKEEVPKGNKDLKAAFPEMDAAARAKALFAIGITAAYLMNPDQQAQAGELPESLIGKVVEAIKKTPVAIADARPFSRVSASQTTSSIIRHGFDTYSKAFGAYRDKYFAKLDILVKGARLLTDSEGEAIRGLSPDKIRTAEALKRWTPAEKNRLIDISGLHKEYRAVLRNEINRVEKLGASVEGLKGWMGKDRYLRMLQHDLNDMTSKSDTDALENVINAATGGIYKSIFLGNQGVALFHGLEAAVTQIGSHPDAVALGMKGLGNKTYREYIELNSPKGTFQRSLESTKGDFPWQKWWDEKINQHIDNAIKKLPHGNTIHEALSAQLPERAKLGFVALCTTIKNAENYPGGAEQYMADYINYSKNGEMVPESRAGQFAEVAVKNQIDMNNAIGYLPEGKIIERRTIERHKFLRLVDPFQKAILQQTGFFAKQLDDVLIALAKKDLKGAGKSLQTFLMGYLIVYGVAGSHAIPDYIWAALEGIDKQKTDQLREYMDDFQKARTGGMQMQDFGVKWAPIFNIQSPVLLKSTQGLIDRLRYPKSRDELYKTGVLSLGYTIIRRIGPLGLEHMQFIAERLQMGMQGWEKYQRSESPESQALGRRLFPKKLVEKYLPYTIQDALIRSVAKVETPAEEQVIKKAQEEQQKLTAADWAKMQGHWTNLPSHNK